MDLSHTNKQRLTDIQVKLVTMKCLCIPVRLVQYGLVSFQSRVVIQDNLPIQVHFQNMDQSTDGNANSKQKLTSNSKRLIIGLAYAINIAHSIMSENFLLQPMTGNILLVFRTTLNLSQGLQMMIKKRVSKAIVR